MTVGLYAESYRGLTIRELELMRPYVRALSLKGDAPDRLQAIELLLGDPEARLVYPRAQRVRKERSRPPWERGRP